MLPMTFHPTSPVILGAEGQSLIVVVKKSLVFLPRFISNRAWNLLGKYKVADISDQQAKTQTVMIDVNLTSIQQGLAKSNPNAEIISVSPKKNLYIAKVSINNEIYEVHLDKTGNIEWRKICGWTRLEFFWDWCWW